MVMVTEGNRFSTPDVILSTFGSTVPNLRKLRQASCYRNDGKDSFFPVPVYCLLRFFEEAGHLNPASLSSSRIELSLSDKDYLVFLTVSLSFKDEEINARRRLFVATRTTVP